ncbi:50S ribosomal protein L24 [Candidatus Saccharibacteria bacterium]|nr:50S ribosomal protein L24 [Candidatus Saccharibacteria bacterium]
MSGIKTGDMVKILAGDNKGKSAKVVRVDREKGVAMLEGIGIRERHIRASYLNPKGGKKEIHVGINLSNLKKEEK